MSDLTYSRRDAHSDKPLAWLHGEIKTPPLSSEARIGAGLLLRRLQRGERLGMPHSRPMPIIGARCHELRIVDGDLTWRIVYRIDPEAILVVHWWAKKTQKTARRGIDLCQRRLRQYDGR